MRHIRENGSQFQKLARAWNNAPHLENHTFKNGSYFKNRVTRVKPVKMCHTWKNGSHLGKMCFTWNVPEKKVRLVRLEKRLDFKCVTKGDTSKRGSHLKNFAQNGHI